MAKAQKNEKTVGVFQLENGNWGYRIVTEVNGVKKNNRRVVDQSGKPFKTQAAAARARAQALKEFSENQTPIPKAAKKHKNSIEVPEEKLYPITFEYVFNKFRENGREDRAFATKAKQDSLWKNYIGPKFGNCLIDSLSVAQINDWLTYLYYNEDRAYLYVEAFLKMFYLIYGQAYSRGYISIDYYNMMCVNKNTKIHMPKMKIDEDTDIVSFTKDQLEQLDEYFHGTNAETAYMLGRYCGVRINEAYGLKWEHVNFDENYILIKQQMQYQNGIILMTQPKSKNAVRKIVMCGKLKEYLLRVRQTWIDTQESMGALRLQNQTLLKDIDGSTISSLDLVNCLPDGKIQTINSMKYHARIITERLGFKFKYHYLRHTYGTMLAAMNTPIYVLCAQMGHGTVKTTQKYYISKSNLGMEELLKRLNQV